MNAAASGVGTLVSAKEIAKQWSICTKTVRRMVDRGVLSPVRLSARCVRFNTLEVAEALAQMSVKDQMP